jgi:hypothetical protein
MAALVAWEKVLSPYFAGYLEGFGKSKKALWTQVIRGAGRGDALAFSTNKWPK